MQKTIFKKQWNREQTREKQNHDERYINPDHQEL